MKMTSDEALKLAERIAKHPAPCTLEQAKRALMKLFLLKLEGHLRSTKT
jgi:hypothetical protein